MILAVRLGSWYFVGFGFLMVGGFIFLGLIHE
jgi:hypothetical protein